MKRKVNLVGQNTLTVSLPSKWAEKNHVEKGDEIDVIEIEGTLTLSKIAKKIYKETTIDVSEYGIMTGRVVGALYKAGYDRVKLTYKDDETLNVIQKELKKGFIGFDIINHSKGYCIIESMATIQPEELDNAMRRLFRLLIDNAEESLNAAKNKDYEELGSIASKDVNVNRFSDFSRRLLNKYGYSNPEKTALVYFIAEDLENIGDDYAQICCYMAKKKFPLSSKILGIYERTCDFLKQFYELYYDFSEQKYTSFGDTYKKLMREMDSNYETFKDKELVVLLKLQSITTSIFDLNGPLITLKL